MFYKINSNLLNNYFCVKLNKKGYGKKYAEEDYKKRLDKIKKEHENND